MSGLSFWIKTFFLGFIDFGGIQMELLRHAFFNTKLKQMIMQYNEVENLSFVQILN